MTPLSVAVSICANAGTPTSRIRSTSVRNGLIRRVVGMVFPLPLLRSCTARLYRPRCEETVKKVLFVRVSELSPPDDSRERARLKYVAKSSGARLQTESAHRTSKTYGWLGGVPKYASRIGFP